MRAVLAVLAMAMILAASGCEARDCDAERTGQKRCVNNQIETCNDDGTLSYESCNTRNLVCSEKLQACVTPEVAMSTVGSGGGGGSASSASGMGGAGG